jgi:hypothetical protein
VAGEDEIGWKNWNINPVLIQVQTKVFEEDFKRR